MNVVFHTTAAIAVAVLLTDTKRIESTSDKEKALTTGALAFILGIISHGALDYIPHAYPINSRLDVFLGLIMIFGTLWLTNEKYRLIMGLSFLGSIFPDIIDLSPAILNKQLGLDLPIFDKVFPWHFPRFSGSMFKDTCFYSTFFNHGALLLTVCMICWSRLEDFKIIFKRG